MAVTVWVDAQGRVVIPQAAEYRGSSWASLGGLAAWTENLAGTSTICSSR